VITKYNGQDSEADKIQVENHTRLLNGREELVDDIDDLINLFDAGIDDAVHFFFQLLIINIAELSRNRRELHKCSLAMIQRVYLYDRSRTVMNGCDNDDIEFFDMYDACPRTISSVVSSQCHRVVSNG
jgi:hypothetical protein